MESAMMNKRNKGHLGTGQRPRPCVRFRAGAFDQTLSLPLPTIADFNCGDDERPSETGDYLSLACCGAYETRHSDVIRDYWKRLTRQSHCNRSLLQAGTVKRYEDTLVSL